MSQIRRKATKNQLMTNLDFQVVVVVTLLTRQNRVRVRGRKRKRKSYKLMEEYDNPCSIKIHTYFVIQKKLLIRLC